VKGEFLLIVSLIALVLYLLLWAIGTVAEIFGYSLTLEQKVAVLLLLLFLTGRRAELHER